MPVYETTTQGLQAILPGFGGRQKRRADAHRADSEYLAMIRPLALLLLLSACTDIRVTEPEKIVQIACAFNVPSCTDAVGLAFPTQSPCVVYVPPLSDETRWIWVHELRHCRDGLDPDEYKTVARWRAAEKE